MTLTEYYAALAIELSDSGNAIFTTAIIDRAVEKTEALLSRMIPKKNIAETTIVVDVTDEALTIATDTGTIANLPVKYDSETIKNDASATMVRDTNYTINYMTGVVTEVGALLPDGAYTVTYQIDPMRLDISTLITNPIRITRIEYPVGDQPPSYLGSFDWIEDYIIFHKDTTLTEDKHIRIYYDSEWTGAAASTDGEYPSHLDDAIIIGASGQCLIYKAEEYVQSSVAELLLVNAAADGMAVSLTNTNLALNKMDTYLVDTAGSGTDNAKDVLANITDDAVSLRTYIASSLALEDTYLTAVATPPSAHDYLVDGDDKINTLNVSDRVAEKYADYARASIQLYQGLAAGVALRLENIRTYIEEAAGWVTIANGFRDEAVQRINDISAWASQADRYAMTSAAYLEIAGRYLASGQSKINEFYIMLGFKPELAHAQASTHQATKY